MAKPWVRLYRDAILKPKVGRLTLEQLGFWSACLMLSDDDGSLPSHEDIAWQLRIQDGEAFEFITELERNGLVTRYVTEGVTKWRLHDWDTHQRKSDHDDSGAERQRKWREAQKAQKSASSDAQQDRNALRNEPVTPPDTDTDTDKKKDMSGSATTDGYPQDFEQFWKAYPRTPNMSKSAALKSWKQQKIHLPPLPDLLAAVAKYRAFLDSETKKQGRAYPAKHAQGWITERRWEGYVVEAQAETTVATAAPDWADDNPKWAAFKRTVPATAWANFFAVCRPNGSESTLIAPTAFVRDQIESRYGSPLFAIFDDFKVKVL